MTLALNQHRCRPDYTIRNKPSNRDAFKSLCVHSFRWNRSTFLSPSLSIIRRETKMFDAESSKLKFFAKSVFNTGWISFTNERAFNELSIPTICFHLLIGSCAITRFRSFVEWKKFRFNGLENCNGLNCQSYSRYTRLQCDLTTFIVWTTNGDVSAPPHAKALHYTCMYVPS